MSGPWYFCMKHKTVEGPDGCSNNERMGPYDSEQEAAAAIEKAAARTQQWDAEDRRWDGDEA